jgi:predicted Holliday junction resolvase-like endonuclease
MLGIEMIVWMVLFIILGMIGSWVIRIKDYVKELEINLLMLSRKMEIGDKMEGLLRENYKWKEESERLKEKVRKLRIEYDKEYLRGREDEGWG